MSAFDKLPPPPQGNSSPEIWQRAFHAAVKQMVCHGVLGGKKIQHPDGGYSLSVPVVNAASPGGQTYRVKSANGDYLVCRTWDGTTEGTTDVKVAKNFDSRQITSETLDSTAFTYAYSGAATVLNRLRTATATNISESQQVTPLWKVNGLIHVAAISYSAVTVDSADLKLIEVSSRCWARI